MDHLSFPVADLSTAPTAALRSPISLTSVAGTAVFRAGMGKPDRPKPEQPLANRNGKDGAAVSRILWRHAHGDDSPA
jgi:hypothetical protein